MRNNSINELLRSGRTRPAAVEAASEPLTVSGAGVAEDLGHAGHDPGHSGSGAKHGEA